MTCVPRTSSSSTSATSMKTDFFAVAADYNSIVHNIGNDGRTPLVQQSPGCGGWPHAAADVPEHLGIDDQRQPRLHDVRGAAVHAVDRRRQHRRRAGGAGADRHRRRPRPQPAVLGEGELPPRAAARQRRSVVELHQLRNRDAVGHGVPDAGRGLRRVAQPAVGQCPRRAPLQLVQRPGEVARVRQPVSRDRRAVGDGRHRRGGHRRRRSGGGPHDQPAQQHGLPHVARDHVEDGAPYADHRGREPGPPGAERPVLSIHDQHRRGHAGAGGSDVVAAGAVVERQDQHELGRPGPHLEADGDAASVAALSPLRFGQPDAANHLPRVRQLGSDLVRRRAHQRAVRLPNGWPRRDRGLRRQQAGTPSKACRRRRSIARSGRRSRRPRTRSTPR